MSKIMVVEDDNSLREIYSIRLTAEGYEVVSAGDGEEALALAVREKPDLILSDVMMPKISGFDMLDILRQTPETKNIKVIMMTALSSEDQRARGEGLGADKYLVKSQVGIEDVINAIHDSLGDKEIVSSTADATNPAQQPMVPEQQPSPATQTASPSSIPATNTTPVTSEQAIPSPQAPSPIPGMATQEPAVAPSVDTNSIPPAPVAPVSPTPIANNPATPSPIENPSAPTQTPETTIQNGTAQA